jgi:hypothetical protein
MYRELEILEAGTSIESTEASATATFYIHSKPSHKIPQQTHNTRNTPQMSCTFCKELHFPSDCTKYKTPDDHMKTVKENQLCYNCSGKHRVRKSKSNCKICKNDIIKVCALLTKQSSVTEKVTKQNKQYLWKKHKHQ